MAPKDDVMKLLTELRTQREDAESRATQAAETLVRQASGLVPLAELDPDQVEAAADDYASAVRELRLLTRISDRVRELVA